MSNPKTSNSGPGIGGQAFLKRKIGTSIEDFRSHYVERHAPIAMPWCLANGVTYYAQVSGPIPTSNLDPKGSLGNHPATRKS
jgi:hypothetical protein